MQKAFFCQDVDPILLCVQVHVFWKLIFSLKNLILYYFIPAFIKFGSKVVEFSILVSSYLTVKDPDPGVLANPQL